METARVVGRPAWRSPIAWITLLLIFVVGLSIDLWSKSWAFDTIAGEPVVLDRNEIIADANWSPPWHEGVEVLPYRLLDLDLVVNHGAVFGIGQQSRVTFIFFTIVAVVVATLIFAFWTRGRSHWAHVGIALILAGGIGNLYDRVAFGAVRDFLHLAPGWDLPFGWHWPNGTAQIFPWVFNGADVLLLSGMAILILRSGRDGADSTESSLDESDRGVDVEQEPSG